MPYGILFIAALLLLLAFGCGEAICSTLHMSRVAAAISLAVLAGSFFLPTFHVDGVVFRIFPFVGLWALAIYLLVNLAHPMRSLFLSFFTGGVLWLLALVLPPTETTVFVPYALYSLLCMVLSTMGSYSRSSAVFNALTGMLILDSLLLFSGGGTALISWAAFNGACFTTFIGACMNGLLAQEVTDLSPDATLRTARAFSFEAGESMKIHRRKRFK